MTTKHYRERIDTMLALLDQGNGPFCADEAEATIACAALKKLSAVAKAKQDIKIAIQSEPNVIVPLPARAVEIIAMVLTQMAKQEPFSIIPERAELTTQQAADYLNVSRPYLVKLLDERKINFRKVGRHRRVRYADLVAFERKTDEEQFQALADMAEEARRLKLE
jgi:excisionase family DNA binding protein